MVSKTEIFLCLLYIFLYIYNMFIYNKHNKHKKTQKGREKKAERLGTQDLWNNMLVSSLGFPFAS